MSVALNLGQMSHEELIRLLETFQNQMKQVEDKNKKLDDETKKLEEENKRLRIKKISSLNNGLELSLLSNAELAERVKARIPARTYSYVTVKLIHDYLINGNIKDVREIILEREINCKLIIDAPTAFFSSLFKSNSIYVKALNSTGIQQFLLNSSELDGKNELVRSIKTDIQAAFTQYKNIRIIVPNDCDGDCDVFIYSKSECIGFAIRAGNGLRFW